MSNQPIGREKLEATLDDYFFEPPRATTEELAKWRTAILAAADLYAEERVREELTKAHRAHGRMADNSTDEYIHERLDELEFLTQKESK